MSKRSSRRNPGPTRYVAVALGLLVGLAASPALAVDWLVFVVDRSRSIDPRELALQRSAYVRLLTDEAVQQALGEAKVAIVEFDTRAEVVVDWSDPSSAARAYRHKAPDGRRGQTGISDAMTTALALLAGKGGRMVIDVSGDGRENVDPLLLAETRAAAGRQLIEINGLAIVTEEMPDIDRYYRERVVNGFVLPVEKRADFFKALKQKFLLEVAGRHPATGSVGGPAEGPRRPVELARAAPGFNRLTPLQTVR